MKGLLLRLSAVDSDAEAAVRVIAYFDELVAHRATISDLVRATASLAECVAGLQRGAEPPVRFRPDGTRAARTQPRVVATPPGGPTRDGGPPAEPRREPTDLGEGRESTRKTGKAARATTAGPGGLTPGGAAPADARLVTTDLGGGRKIPAEAHTSASELGGEAPATPHTVATNPGGRRDDRTPAKAHPPDSNPHDEAPTTPHTVAPTLGKGSNLGSESPTGPRTVTTDLGGAHDREVPVPESDLGGRTATAPRVLATDLGGQPAGRVWLERDGESGPLDDLVLERFAIAAGAGAGAAGRAATFGGPGVGGAGAG
ncbi:hypothetical protein AB0F91_08130 [Amycolatopsis sp. NPDC023774]|uniref:hypothetical protein n=1 Tax=Amycolatopsis sp. NPDC023774 TaxID=3155015 RepID=UPI0033ED53D3